MRRVVRPRRAADARTAVRRRQRRRSNLLARVNAGEVSAAPPKAVPPGVCRPSTRRRAAAHPAGAPGWILELLAQYPWLPWAVLIALLVIAIVLLLVLPTPAGAIAAVVAAAVGIGAFALLRNWQSADAPAQGMSEANQTPAAVDAAAAAIPASCIADPGSTVTLGARRDRQRHGRSVQGLRCATRSPWLDAARIAGQRPAPARSTLPLPRERSSPASTRASPSRAAGSRRSASRPGSAIRSATDFDEVMAYPEIDLPMYEPLKAISTELFLPNINLIEQNSITLLETNQKFIEAYMVGLNHEFARELLWREYPDRPARQLLPPVLGRAQLHRQRRAERGPAQGEAPRHPAAAPLGAGLEARRARQPRAARAQPAEAAGRARDPRRAAEEVPDRGDLRAPRGLWQRNHRRHDRPDRGRACSISRCTPAEEAEPAARQGPQPALRGQGRSGHLLLRLRPDGRGGEGRQPARSRPTIRAGSSSSRSGRASRASASSSSSATLRSTSSTS